MTVNIVNPIGVAVYMPPRLSTRSTVPLPRVPAMDALWRRGECQISFDPIESGDCGAMSRSVSAAWMRAAWVRAWGKLPR